MKRILLFVCLFSIFLASAQDSIVNYLDKQGKVLSLDQLKRTEFIEVIKPKDTLWLSSHYYKDGTLRYYGHYNSENKEHRVGEHIYYHSSGHVSQMSFYDDTGRRHGPVKTWDSETKQLTTSGFFKEDKKQGVWNYRFPDGAKKARIIYKNDSIVKYNLWYADGRVKDQELILERPADYKGGIKVLYHKVAKELAPKLKYFDFRGKIWVRFKVSDRGVVDEVKINPYVSNEFYSVISRYFKSLKDWEPAVYLNENIYMYFSLPVVVQ